jgi:L-seryl-tRNA(Ser) seleniumtransferase
VNTQQRLRALPSVDQLASAAGAGFPRELAVDECRRLLEELRARILAGEEVTEDPELLAATRLAALRQPSLRRVINATGVVIHTNLGRAPLPAYTTEGGYSNLEYDLETGKRGRRDSHTAGLLQRLFGAPAILVNNGAAAVFLALHELAGDGEVIVSRGELIEIGDGFRIPDIMARSGARLVEVGATNRTTAEDYRRALTLRTRLLMRVHPSNFRMEGFTGRPTLEELSSLARERGIPLYEDLGSGSADDLSCYGIQEPTVQDSLRQGADLVSFSGDKLLGGPQAGILAGRADLIERLRTNPMYRALRLDKLVIGAMETCLRAHLLQQPGGLPVHRILQENDKGLLERTERLARELGLPISHIAAGRSLIGGGTTPGQSLPTYLLSLPGNAQQIERRLRSGNPPVIARIEEGNALLDLRTVLPEEEPDLLLAVRSALAS